MKTIQKVSSDSQDFQDLVKLLDSDLAIRDGEDHAFYNQFNTLDKLQNCIVLYQDSNPVACGAFRIYSDSIVEIKRMYTNEKFRGAGFASAILQELEIWAKDLGFKKCILETGIKQPEAIGLYLKNAYHKIPNYDQYKGVDTSVCFEKDL